MLLLESLSIFQENNPNIEWLLVMGGSKVDNNNKVLIEKIKYLNRVRWRESVIYMMKKNINHFIEIGPGKPIKNIGESIVFELLEISLF